MSRIKTSYEVPPCPIPPFWRAWSDDLGADSSPYGEGPTEAEAIADLKRQLEEQEPEQ